MPMSAPRERNYVPNFALESNSSVQRQSAKPVRSGSKKRQPPPTIRKLTFNGPHRTLGQRRRSTITEP